MKNIPDFLKLILSIDMWEAFSRFGMRCLLVIFLTSQLSVADEDAFGIYMVFGSVCAFLPVVVGVIADRYLGAKVLAEYGAITIITGHLLMIFIDIVPEMIYPGISLIAVGTGLFKGNLATILGECYGKEKNARIFGYTAYYIALNVGALISAILCAYAAHIWSWGVGFSIAAAGMAFGLQNFLRKKKILDQYGNSPIGMTMSYKIGILSLRSITISSIILLSCLVTLGLFNHTIVAKILTLLSIGSVLVIATLAFRMPDKNDRNNTLVILLLSFFTIIFYFVDTQCGSLISLFADRNVVTSVYGIVVPSAVSQALNPIGIMIVGSYLVFKKNQSTINSSINNFGLGILAISLSFLIMWFGCLNANIYGLIPYSYLLFGNVIMGGAELFILPFLMAQASILAPKKYKGLIMGFVNMNLALSFLSSPVLAKFASIPSDIKGNALESLVIYQATFQNIAIFYFIVTIIFLLFIPIIKKVLNSSNNNITK